GRGRATGNERDADQERRGRRARLAPAEKRAVVEKADDAATDEDEGYLGLQCDRDHKRGGGECPLEPIFHPELRQPVARVEDERDDGGTDAVKDRGHGRESLEVDVERGEARDNDEVRQDEGPAAGPRAPEAA